MFRVDAHIKNSEPYPESFQHQFTGLDAQISEKQLRKNLIHSNHAVLKSLLQLYLSIVKHLTLRYTYLKKKKSNQNALYVTFQPVFSSNFERSFSVCFKHHHSF